MSLKLVAQNVAYSQTNTITPRTFESHFKKVRKYASPTRCQIQDSNHLHLRQFNCDFIDS